MATKGFKSLSISDDTMANIMQKLAEFKRAGQRMSRSALVELAVARLEIPTMPDPAGARRKRPGPAKPARGARRGARHL